MVVALAAVWVASVAGSSAAVEGKAAVATAEGKAVVATAEGKAVVAKAEGKAVVAQAEGRAVAAKAAGKAAALVAMQVAPEGSSIPTRSSGSFPRTKRGFHRRDPLGASESMDQFCRRRSSTSHYLKISGHWRCATERSGC